MAKFPTYEEMGKKVAEKALDEFLYDGKSIREWMQIIASEDAISRQAVLDATVKKNSIWNSITNSKGENLEEIISQLPPVNPQKTDEQILTEIFVIYQRRIPAIAYKSNYIPRMGDIIHFPHFGGFRVKSVAYRIADDAGIDGNRLMWVELFVEKYEEINCKTTKCENAGGMNV